jgi:hypothetical protein
MSPPMPEPSFDGKHLFQIAESRIRRSIRRPAVCWPRSRAGRRRRSGLTWAEGTLWVGQYRERKIHQIDPETGAILRTIRSNNFVTGVTWSTASSGTAPGKASRAGEEVDPRTGEALEVSRCRPA